MNKILLFSVFIMIFLSLISITFGITGVIIDDNEDSINGYWEKTDAGLGAQWHNNLTGHNYQAQSIMFGFAMDPRDHPEVSFKWWNDDTGRTEIFDDLADCEKKYGPEAEGVTTEGVNLFDVIDFWGVLIFAMGVGVAAGVYVLDTGLSEWAQRLVFLSSIWGGTWLFLTSNTYPLLINDNFGLIGSLLYTCITLMFIFGLIFDVQSTGGV